jgi:hypothetical protein
MQPDPDIVTVRANKFTHDPDIVIVRTKELTCDADGYNRKSSTFVLSIKEWGGIVDMMHGFRHKMRGSELALCRAILGAVMVEDYPTPEEITAAKSQSRDRRELDKVRKLRLKWLPRMDEMLDDWGREYETDGWTWGH